MTTAVQGLCVLLLALLGGCDVMTDSGTRLGYDIESGAKRLGPEEGATYRIEHRPANASECSHTYTVQLDKVGALIVWCQDASGQTVASGSTTFHSRFIDTPETWIIDKEAGTTLVIVIERRNGRAVVIDVK